MVSNEDLMQKALEVAWDYQGLTFPNPAVGALVVDAEKNILSQEAHKIAGEAHAEVLAIKQAYIKLTQDTKLQEINSSKQIHEYLYKNHAGIFFDKSIYVTLEPCNHFGKTPPCSSLLSRLGFKNVFIGIKDPNPNASGGYEKLKNDGLHVKLGILEDRCATLLEPFCIWQKKPFVFFKLALSKNFVIKGGIITSEASRRHVHALRDRCDLLVIGGNTVRVDRPTLDARLVQGKAPDILIYSRHKDFDTSIPLFHVPNRKVFIEDNLKRIKDYRFVMVEGGEDMLKACQEEIDWYLFYQSHHIIEGKSIKIDIKLEEVFSKNIAEDRLTWYKKIHG
jgi:diaminohydroxyphosphoribosylaminopyrimidine deaminase/5-amino-6-(5-phosphoribosylamino)uracil reductase